MSADKITIRCAKCGSDQLIKPDNPKPDDIVTCAGCGATCKFGDLQATAMEKAKELLSKAFPGLKWK